MTGDASTNDQSSHDAWLATLNPEKRVHELDVQDKDDIKSDLKVQHCGIEFATSTLASANVH